MDKNYYFNYSYKELAYMIRSSACIEYGNFYCHNYKFRTENKKQYFDEVSKLVESSNIILKKMAFHYISNTLINDRDPNEVVDVDFIPLLKKLFFDEILKDFCISELRKEFFLRNINR